ncbi:BZ3500_MvSof-1268-A1-R1_Chr9g10789 [Microbotryum saponariae]|uniref:BZ3500_MvSof-1268-A1-R1_Chr9g10789 protein n=1 Tax=Microbotryum saponariae TaxID=289078 RepID=A0A2X0LW37_9BASI|nr:BZ3501_MvSof-1269-A2-R1_Chr9g10537 [Microbotryum saponariae]SDA00695.1 BZ3500_MvSof-1268-A1-R1_Chr9g10789 [Microbotryum saponariae]
MSKPSSTATTHTQLPPTYQPHASSSAGYGATNDDRDPLLQAAARGDDEDDIPEDFKIGVTVSQSSKDVRMQFVRKVYIVLTMQLLATFGVGMLMRGEAATQWTREHSGLMMIPILGSFAMMLGAFWKRHSHPLNLVFLGAFTLCEGVSVGAVVSFYDQRIVLLALGITLGLFVGLTLFTLQSRYEFDSMGPYLFSALLVFFITSLVGMFIPFSNTMDLIMAAVGVLLFSMYIIYDTHMLMKRLHVDDWVMASISLYLDFINLFLQVLRLLSDIQDR